MSDKSIILVGTVHLDTDAYSSLSALLKKVPARCLAVEISGFSISFREKKTRRVEG